MKFFDLIEKYIFPWNATCNICNKENPENNGLCENCTLLLEKVTGQRCEICLDRIDTVGLCKNCLEKTPYFDKVFAPFVYGKNVRNLIKRFKFNNARYLKHVLAPLMLGSLPKEVIDECDLLIPVPLAKSRMRKRGYNQAELLCNELSIKTNIPVDKHTLLKNEGQKQMAKLNRSERTKSVQSYYFCSNSLENKNVILVDDIMTTGSTANECAHQLKRAGAQNVFVLVCARTDKNN